MPTSITLRLRDGRRVVRLPATLDASGDDARASFDAARAFGGLHLLLRGFPDYAVTVTDGSRADWLATQIGRSAWVESDGRAVRRTIAEVSTAAAPTTGSALEISPGLFLQPDGIFSVATGSTKDALVAAARWISSRRTTTFTRLFAPDAFHPELPVRTERLTVAQGERLLAWLEGLLPGADNQLRSAILTVLSHLVATAKDDVGFRSIADGAAAAIFGLIDVEKVAALRAHAILLLQLRGPALTKADQDRARGLLQSLVRVSPPYEALPDVWTFAMNSAWDFHEGEVVVLQETHGFVEVGTDLYEAPFTGPKGQKIRVHARTANPTDENREMADPAYVGVLINRHAQLGSFDLRAATVNVQQQGYKLLINSQCAGLTTRFAIGRMFPDADLYTSWDSTYFQTGGPNGRLSASEGLDCFVAILHGMSKGETHAQISDRIRRAQWHHPQASAVRDFVQFVGPAHPAVIQRHSDVNQDGRADCYDGFLDFELAAIAERVADSGTPKDPGVAPSQVSGEAATGLGWAAGSMNRVLQYSDLWASMPGYSELLYVFESAGFYDAAQPPVDVAGGGDPGRLPAVCRYLKTGPAPGDFKVEVMLHSHLAHTGKELKRLLVAADAAQRAFALGYLPSTGDFATPAARRGFVLLTLAGLLEFPADQNWISGLWSIALKMLRFPEISLSTVRACITEQDHDASNYYGSRRGLRQLVDTLQKSDPVVYAALASPDATVGIAAPI